MNPFVAGVWIGVAALSMAVISAYQGARRKNMDVELTVLIATGCLIWPVIAAFMVLRIPFYASRWIAIRRERARDRDVA